MELSELQSLIIDGLKICGINTGEITLAMLLLKTPDQQWEMATYLNSVVGNPPEAIEVMRTVREIAGAQ